MKALFAGAVRSQRVVAVSKGLLQAFLERGEVRVRVG